MRHLALVTSTVFAFAALAACLGQDEPIVLVEITDHPPDTTIDLSVRIAGRVLRSPADASIPLTVSVTGGAADVHTEPGHQGLFGLDVPLLPDTENHLILVAEDATGVESTPRTWTVTHESTAQALSPSAPNPEYP